MSKPFLSAILPVSKEIENLPLIISDVDQHLENLKVPTELIVVSFGNKNNVGEIVKKMSEAVNNLKFVNASENSGIGDAIRQGMLLASGEIRLIIDSNNFISAQNIKNMLPLFKAGADIVIGHRHLIQKTNPALFFKWFLPQPINFFFRKAFFKNLLKDPTSSFRGFTADSAEKIFSLSKSKNRNFLIETIKLAQKSNLRIQEVPVSITFPSYLV